MTAAADEGGGGGGGGGGPGAEHRSQLGGLLQRCRESRQLVLVIVAIALLLDNMLLTTVEPGGGRRHARRHRRPRPHPRRPRRRRHRLRLRRRPRRRRQRHHHAVAQGAAGPAAAQGPDRGDGGRGHDVRLQGLRAAARQPHRRPAHPQNRIQRSYVYGVYHHVSIHSDLRVRAQLLGAVRGARAAGHRLVVQQRVGHGHAGGALPRRQGARQRHGHRAGRAGARRAHRAALRGRHVRVRGQERALPHPLRARARRRTAAAAGASAGRGAAGVGPAVAQSAGHGPLHHRGGRRHHVRQHGHRNAGAVAAHLDDGQDAGGPLATGRGLPARQHLLPHRDQPLRPARPPHGQMVGIPHWSGSHRCLPHVYPAGREHQPPDRSERGPRLRHRHGGLVHDARAGLPGGHPPLGRLRQRLRHRRRRLLPGIRHRSGHERHARQHHRLRVDAVRHRGAQLPVRAAHVPAPRAAHQGGEAVADPGREELSAIRHVPKRGRRGVGGGLPPSPPPPTTLHPNHIHHRRGKPTGRRGGNQNQYSFLIRRSSRQRLCSQ